MNLIFSGWRNSWKIYAVTLSKSYGRATTVTYHGDYFALMKSLTRAHVEVCYALQPIQRSAEAIDLSGGRQIELASLQLCGVLWPMRQRP